MIKLKDILVERVSDIVYHFTEPGWAYSILMQNKFKLQQVPKFADYQGLVNLGKKYDKGYYMSVARTKVEGFTRINEMKCTNVRLELNGTKLSQRYKGGAYDAFPQYQGEYEYEEFEDRIYSRTEFIPSALDYIKRIDINKTGWCMDITIHSKDTIDLIWASTKLSIPTFVYTDKNKFFQQSGGIEITDVKEYKQLLKTMKQGKI